MLLETAVGRALAAVAVLGGLAGLVALAEIVKRTSKTYDNAMRCIGMTSE